MNDVQKKVSEFFSQFEKRRYKKGDIIIHPDSATGAFYLNSGFIREYGISLQGTEITIHIFTPHSFFPMTWIMTDIPNRYYYEALTDIEGYIGPKEKVILFLKENPDVLFSLTQRLLQGLDKLTSRLEHMAFNKASKKIVSIILYLARHFGQEKNGKVYIEYKFSHKDLGAMAALTRETTSREWGKLEKKGLISVDNQLIVINNMDKLRAEL